MMPALHRLPALLFLLMLPARSPAAQPAAWPAALAAADSLVRAAVAAGEVPGAVLLVARDGTVRHEAAYGYAQRYTYDLVPLDPPEPMTTDHLFDLASLTKVMATTFAVMLLVDDGQVALDAPVHRYLPAFHGPHKDSVTVRHLLTHTAGLAPWKPTYYHARSAPAVLRYISGLPLAYPVGRARHYSDLGFMLLGYLVEAVSGRPLDAFLQARLYAPLGLTHTTFTPPADRFPRIAATSHGNPFEQRMVADDDFGYVCDEDPAAFQGWRRYTLRGEVNDGNAYYAHGGVAGHAGLFATATDLHVLLELLLHEGRHEGRRLIRPETVRAFLTPDAFGNGLGWGMTPEVMGVQAAPPGAFGHRGFTGTQAAAVPAYGLSILLLTNRQHGGPDADGYYPNLTPLQHRITSLLIHAARRDTP